MKHNLRQLAKPALFLVVVTVGAALAFQQIPNAKTSEDAMNPPSKLPSNHPVLVLTCGGQSGVDRAVADVARQLRIMLRGWVPLDRQAEDGRIPPEYPFQETESTDVDVRTELNIADSDGTLTLRFGNPTDGTRLMKGLAQRYGKPYKEVDMEHPVAPEEVQTWIRENHIRVLNIGGNRGSWRPHDANSWPRDWKPGFVYETSRDYLSRLLSTHP